MLERPPENAHSHDGATSCFCDTPPNPAYRATEAVIRCHNCKRDRRVKVARLDPAMWVCATCGACLVIFDVYEVRDTNTGNVVHRPGDMATPKEGKRNDPGD